MENSRSKIGWSEFESFWIHRIHKHYPYNPQTSMNIHENPCNPMKFHEIPWNSIHQPLRSYGPLRPWFFFGTTELIRRMSDFFVGQRVEYYSPTLRCHLLSQNVGFGAQNSMLFVDVYKCLWMFNDVCLDFKTFINVYHHENPMVYRCI